MAQKRSEIDQSRKLKNDLKSGYKELESIGLWRILGAFVLLGFIIFSSIMLLWLISMILSTLFFPIFAKNMEPTLRIEIPLIILSALALSICSVSLLLFYNFFTRKIPNIWLYSMIFFMTFFAFSGMFFIENQGLMEDINFILRDLNNEGSEYGHIKCTDHDKKLYVGDIVNCEVSPNLKNSSIVVRLFSGKEIIFDQLIKNNQFKAIDGVTRVEFLITGIDSSGNKRILATGWKFKFLTDELVLSNNQKFLNYLFALISLVFVLVPSSLSSIKHLLDK